MSEILTCERCGDKLQCNREQISDCFCNKIHLSKHTIELLGAVYKGCLCKNCLDAMDSLVIKSKKHPSSQNGLLQDIHYYMENDLFVFTEIYHIQKGYCCENTCRHCPYSTH